MIYTAHYSSPVGEFLLAERDGCLTGLWLEGQKYYFNIPAEKAAELETPGLSLARAWLDRYFAGEAPAPGELKLSPQGSAFRQLVWEALCRIPYGQVITYGRIAEEIALHMGRKSMSAQAIGGAVGHNPISIIIPCHRVVGANGNLTGYAGGVDKKLKLLAHEGVDISRFSFP